MGSKRALFNIKGMSRDLAASKFSSEFAYENMNMRLVATDDHTSLALTNERGTKGTDIDWDSISGIPTQGDFVSGMPIGQQVLDDNLILFTAGNKESIDISTTPYSEELPDITPQSTEEFNISSEVDDNIYKFWFDGETLKGRKLFQGDLKFSRTNPIECIGVYENEGIQKVYWTDGINPPRVINAAADKAHIDSWDPNAFNFVNDIKLRENITVTRDIVAGGVFAPGTIQYVFTYYKLYGQETNIFYTSPLLYTSYADRGASPDDTVSNSFTITLDNLDTRFDYVRVYSVLRTSLDTTPQVRQVVDLEISKTSTDPMIYVDNGIGGETIDATKLLYVGGEEVIVGTMEQKDNKLFMGDITYNGLIIPDEIQASFLEDNILKPVFVSGEALRVLGEFGGFYNYSSQLKYSSRQIKGFKYLEWYRFGLQFQYKTGRWSAPVWVGDVQNEDIRPSTKIFSGYGYFPIQGINIPKARKTLAGSQARIFDSLISLGYVKVRPVIVYPKLSDRDIICQGILCPTVYNTRDRAGNFPFVQSSWFARANAPFDISRYDADVGGSTPTWVSYINAQTPSLESRSGAVTIENKQLSGEELDLVNKGSWPEFRHNYALPHNLKRNCEIQCNNYDSYYRSHPTTYNGSPQQWADYYSDVFFVDQSIVTLHSPEIEFNNELKGLDASNLKLRIVGTVPLTAFNSYIDIQTSTPPMNHTDSSTVFSGFYSEGVNTTNASVDGWRALISAPMWCDGCIDDTSGRDTGRLYVVYPWQRSGSLNNTKSADTDGYKSALLSKKILSNTRFSYNSLYLTNIWNAEDLTILDSNNKKIRTGVTGIYIFDSNEITPIKLPAQDSGLDDMIYYGNADEVITRYHSYIIRTSSEVVEGNSGTHRLFTREYAGVPMTDTKESSDAVSIKYKSTPHAVMALKNTEAHWQRVLPTFTDSFDNQAVNSVNGEIPDYGGHQERFFWDEERIIPGVLQDQIVLPDDGDSHYGGGADSNGYATRFGFLWLGEIYNDNVQNRFGGNTQEALANNQWTVAGNEVSLLNEDGTLKTYFDIQWTEGDTYYQRYDCVKTYPFTKEDVNSVVDTISFMCETRVNIDGRYDKLRGINTPYIYPGENFNLINTAYSQLNNYFNYRYTNLDKLVLNHFPNTIVWSGTKTLGEEVDSWTNVVLSKTLELDGDKGTVRALRKVNDYLFAFQDSGVSQILYNDNVQIASTTGVPIEIANSSEVLGKRYVGDHIGCTNKWSICRASTGLYFIDDRTKDLYMFNGQQFTSASDKLGFHSWMAQNFNGVSVWNPKDFESAVTYYDKTNQDIFFITKDACLGFNENLGNFSSFYSYEHVPYFANLEDRGIFWQKAENDTHYKPWLYREGEYNKFFNKYQPYWTEVVVNSEPTVDKIFNNLEFRADSFEGETYIPEHTFDTLEVKNEYQENTVELENKKDKVSNLKKKFRIWRVQIPRNRGSRDRMRNPWLYLKLSMEKENSINSNYKTVLHDLAIDYFE